MAFTLQTELRQMARDIRAFPKEAAFAHVVALTRTGQEIKLAEEEAIKAVFDRPTPFAQRSIYLKPATKANPVAIVNVKNSGVAGTNPTRFLAAQIDSGERRLKRFERALQRAGAMPAGWYAVPGRFARLDAYGNLSGGQITQILSQLRSFQAGSKRQNLAKRDGTAKTDTKIRRAYTRAGGQYIALPQGRGRLKPGIYQRRDSALGSAAPRPVIIFVQQVIYRERLDFDGIARRVADERYERNLNTALIEFGNSRGVY